MFFFVLFKLTEFDEIFEGFQKKLSFSDNVVHDPLAVAFLLTFFDMSTI